MDPAKRKRLEAAGWRVVDGAGAPAALFDAPGPCGHFRSCGCCPCDCEGAAGPWLACECFTACRAYPGCNDEPPAAA